MLVYWASWCVPCRHFREKLERSGPYTPESELRMLAVSLDRDPGPAMAYLARSPLPYPARIGDAELIKARSGMPCPRPSCTAGTGAWSASLWATFRKKRLGHYVGRIVRRAECREAPRSRAGRRVSAAGKSVFPAGWEGVCSRAYPVPV